MIFLCSLLLSILNILTKSYLSNNRGHGPCSRAVQLLKCTIWARVGDVTRTMKQCPPVIGFHLFFTKSYLGKQNLQIGCRGASSSDSIVREGVPYPGKWVSVLSSLEFDCLCQVSLRPVGAVPQNLGALHVCTRAHVTRACHARVTYAPDNI